jgi:hypothetical protein
MPIDSRPPCLLFFETLACHELALPVVEIQPRCFSCDFLHLLDNTGPALKVARTVRIETDDVAESCDFFHIGGFLENNGRVAFAVAFYGCSDASEARAYY